MVVGQPRAEGWVDTISINNNEYPLALIALGARLTLGGGDAQTVVQTGMVSLLPLVMS